MAIGFGLPHSVSTENRKLFRKARVTFVNHRLTAIDSVRFTTPCHTKGGFHNTSPGPRIVSYSKDHAGDRVNTLIDVHRWLRLCRPKIVGAQSNLNVKRCTNPVVSHDSAERVLSEKSTDPSNDRLDA